MTAYIGEATDRRVRVTDSLIPPSDDSSTRPLSRRYGDLGDRVADNLNVMGEITAADQRELDPHITKDLWIEGAHRNKSGNTDPTTAFTGARPAS